MKKKPMLLVKSRVEAYTRKDGTLVAAHDNGKQAAAPKPAAGRRPAAKAHAFDHPNVVGHARDHKVVGEGGRETAGNGDLTHPTTTSMSFAGRTYRQSGGSGKSLHDDTPVERFESDDGHVVWGDAKGRVHADSTDEVESLRKKHAEHEAKQGAPAEKPKKARATKPTGDAKKPGTWQEAQEHAVKSGAKFKSGVAVFGSADNAHSHAERGARSKGGAFVMKHPDHDFHVVVNGADSQRMERNGYQHVKPT